MNPCEPGVAADDETPGNDYDDKREMRHQYKICS